jgi:hypothetical protein
VPLRLAVQRVSGNSKQILISSKVANAITKAITEKKERAWVPPLTEYDGTKDKLPIFLKEVKAWLEDCA